MKCDHCGAPDTGDGAFCSHCGNRVRRPAAPAHRAATDPARFDLVRAHPGYAAACQHVPAVPTLANIVGPAFMMVFGIGFTAVSGGFILGGPGRGPPAFFAVIWFGFCAVFVGAALWMMIKGLRFRAAPVVNHVLVVVDERSEVRRGTGKNASTSTHYYATVQARDGSRQEYGTEAWLAGRIAPGDIGVAFLKADMLVDFLRIEV